MFYSDCSIRIFKTFTPQIKGMSVHIYIYIAYFTGSGKLMTVNSAYISLKQCIYLINSQDITQLGVHM